MPQTLHLRTPKEVLTALQDWSPGGLVARRICGCLLSAMYAMRTQRRFGQNSKCFNMVDFMAELLFKNNVVLYLLEVYGLNCFCVSFGASNCMCACIGARHM